MHIRPLQQTDIPAVAALLATLARQFIINESSPEAARAFLDANGEDGLRGMIERGFVYHLAEIGEQVVGFIGLREHKHLFHMFVASEHHGQGLGRALWAVARQGAVDAGGSGVFTVNASNHAVAVYEKLGFVRTAPTQFVNGIYFNPMQLDASVSPLVGAP